MRVLGGVVVALRERVARRRLLRFVDSSRIENPAERELVEGDYGDWKLDVYSASGDGGAVPGLPEATAKELYGEFEHDQEKPSDRAP